METCCSKCGVLLTGRLYNRGNEVCFVCKTKRRKEYDAMLQAKRAEQRKEDLQLWIKTQKRRIASDNTSKV
jgi:hypothetical protein